MLATSTINSWAVKTVEGLPDGNSDTAYTNQAGEVMLLDHHDATSGNDWDTFDEYDSLGHVILAAQPSAVTGYSDSYADLLHSVSGNYQYLSDSSGLITVYDYASGKKRGQRTLLVPIRIIHAVPFSSQESAADQWLGENLRLNHWAEHVANDEWSDGEEDIPVYPEWRRAARSFALDEDGWGSEDGWNHVGHFSSEVAQIGLGGGSAPSSEGDESPALKQCFPAGTLVSTVAGLRPIESVVAGEEVWAYDLVASQWRPCRVRQTFRRLYEGTSVFVTVGGETIEATALHPYWVVRGEGLEGRPRRDHLPLAPSEATTPGRWVDAADLHVGDELLLRDGRVLPVQAWRRSPFQANVYNFDVEELQCYAVGKGEVLVHNNNAAEGTPTSPTITPEELAGKTRTQIRDMANEKGLKPAGDTTGPDYPRKWKDPVTGEERLRLDRGHTDPKTGKPYDNPNAAGDHVHGYDQDGNKILHEGDPHIPTVGE